MQRERQQSGLKRDGKPARPAPAVRDASALHAPAPRFRGMSRIVGAVHGKKVERERIALRALIDHLPDCIYVKDRQGRFVAANAATGRLMGVDDPRQLIGKTDAHFYPDSAEREFRGDEKRVFETGAPLVNKDEPHTDPSGNHRDILTTKVALRDAAGEIVGLVGVGRDITELRDAERALRDAEIKYRTVADNTHDWEFWLGPDERLLYVSPSCERFTGRGPGEFLADPDLFLSIVHPDDRSLVRHHLATCLGTSGPDGCEFRVVHRDGRVLWIGHVCQPVFDDAGGFLGRRGSNRDITARKHAEHELRQLNERLEQRVAERTAQLRALNESMQAELRIARELQHAMLPITFPTLPRGSPSEASAVAFASAYQPAGLVSGDFFDLIPLGDTKVGMFICDVMGHDVSAALVTAMLRSLVEERGPDATDPAALLSTINRTLCRVLRQGTSDSFVTAFYLIADVTTGDLRFANAGHPLPLHLHRALHSATPLDLSGATGPALGLFADAAYRSRTARMDPGDIVLLFTDGLFEVQGPDDELYSEARLAEAAGRRTASPVGRLVPDLVGDIQAFSGAGGFGDDLCVVGMEFRHRLPPAA